MAKKLKRFLKDRSGFTLSETLVAVVILILVTSVVALGIPVAVNVYDRVVTSANAQVLLSTTMTCLRDELGTATDVSYTGTTISYKNSSGVESTIKLGNDAGAGTTSEKGVFLQYVTVMDGTIVRRLVSDAAANKNLYMTYTIHGYADGVLTLENLEVKKLSDNSVMASIPQYDIRVLTDLS